MQAQSPPLTIQYPESLPVSERRQEIADALRDHQVIVIAGETGSGKTTQIPKICLEAGFGVRGLIGHTQPRRLAARSVAARIAEELDVPLGGLVGYQVRFSDHSGPDTRVKLMTDGILLNEIQRDRKLRKYDVLIIDEAHERSLNIDFLLGYLRQLMVRRPDLKIIITSATIDVDKFSRHFNDAPILSVSGRSFPVDILYRDPSGDDQEESDDDVLTRSVLRALNEVAQIDRRRGRTGDVLVFLSGEREIRDVAAALRKRPLPDTEVLPLYARLSHSEQKKIFQPHRGRRIVLSTNVAETSLTVPGIEYVIDSGLARIGRYSVASKVQRLPIEPISQASANQRAGRCGRIAPGVCIRLYGEEDFQGRPEFTDPEIQRTNLSAVILQMLMLKLGDIEQFPFVERPARRAINDGFRLLGELGAIDEQRRLTDVGRQMARLPVDPRLGRMLVDAMQQGCLYELLIIVSALSIQDPRETPADARQAARQHHARFDHPDSDFMSFLSLWEHWEEQRQSLSQNHLRRYAREHYLNFLRLREWRETHRQLLLACQKAGLKVPRQPAGEEPDYAAIHRSIIRGSLNQIGMKTAEKSYLGSRNRQFELFPSSTLYRRRPRWVVTAELIETSRLFATLAARIEPEWVTETAPDWLLRREYQEPHWEKKRGQVIAFEKTTLFGLVLIEKQRRHYGPIDPVLSRQIFIREALVEGQLQTRRRFLADNRSLIGEIRREEEKLRRPDILVSEEEMFAFYDQRVPQEVYSARQFENWCRKVDVDQQRILHMSRRDLRREADDDQATQRHFPDRATIQDNPLTVRYRFEPGREEDGASIDVPLALLDQLQDTDLDWAVPGLVADRCVALLKGLPKALRKQFIPVPAFVGNMLKDAEPGRLSLRQLIRQEALRRKGVEISSEALDAVPLPPHLLTRVRLLDEKGRVLASDSDLGALRRRFAEQASRAEPAVTRTHPLVQENMRDWQGEVLPEQVTIEQGVTLQRYPALSDCGESVAIRLFSTPARAHREHIEGLIRLLLFRTPQQRKSIEKSLKALPGHCGLRFPAGWNQFPKQAVRAVYRQHFDPDHHSIRSPAAFARWLEHGRADLMETADRDRGLFEKIIALRFDIQRILAAMDTDEERVVRVDIAGQLDELLGEGFPAGVPGGWLREYPKYLQAIQLRIERFRRDLERDRDSMEVIRTLRQQYDRLPDPAAQLPDFPWLLQELRVSLFAQQLGTRRTVSRKRLQRMLDQATGPAPG
ncbi:MAG: ATP-dependent RNA helicase HrpA [Pseudohongiellaceae bacterium]